MLDILRFIISIFTFIYSLLLVECIFDLVFVKFSVDSFVSTSNVKIDISEIKDLHKLLE
jgi:hypothetical protein